MSNKKKLNKNNFVLKERCSAFHFRRLFFFVWALFFRLPTLSLSLSPAKENFLTHTYTLNRKLLKTSNN